MKLHALALVALTVQLSAFTLPDATPEETSRFFTEQGRTFVFFDSARTIPYSDPSFIPPAWVSRFGSLTGGTTFNTDLFQLTDPLTATVWWDFLQSGYRMKYVSIHWHANGMGGERLYSVPYGIATSTGPLSVESPSGVPIVSIAFYGFDPTRLEVPESSPPVVLLGALVAALAIFRRSLV